MTFLDRMGLLCKRASQPHLVEGLAAERSRGLCAKPPDRFDLASWRVRIKRTDVTGVAAGTVVVPS